MCCTCPDTALALGSQLARTQSSAQLIPARSVWSHVPKSWGIGFMKTTCVLTAPKTQLLGEAVLREEPLKWFFAATPLSVRGQVIFFQAGPCYRVRRQNHPLAFSMSKSAQTSLWFHSITFARALL